MKPDTLLGGQRVAAGRLAYPSVLDPALRPQALAVAHALRAREDLDPGAMTDLVQVYGRLGEGGAILDPLPVLCTSSPTGCSDLRLNPNLLSLHGNPLFEALVEKHDTTSLSSAAAASASSSP